MSKVIDTADVVLWGTKIGTILWHNNLGYFEYEKGLLGSGIELSPIKMPLADKSYTFGALNRDTYKGLPGLLSDSLPDKFGNKLIDQWLEKQGRDVYSFSPIDRLCYIGTRGMGALEFMPVIGNKTEKSQPLEVSELVELANNALGSKQTLSTDLGSNGPEKQQAVEQIISVGTSAGGARAKAIIAWNEQTNEVRSGQVKTNDDFTYWLLKFDGVEENRDHELLADPQGYSIVEYAYYLMAREAGIDMSSCRLFKENGRAHFMTKRFDRLNGGDKLHMQSLCGLAHFDFNLPGAYSYEQAFGVMRDLRLPSPEFREFYRRMVFNVIARNQDDHTKNISFLMNKRGQWSLAPAYDITYCYGKGWTQQHQMTVNGKRDNFTLDDLLAVATHGDLDKNTATRIINDVLAAVSQWQGFAEQAGVPEQAPGIDTAITWSGAIAKGHRIEW
ncbi:MAG: type II toxin-antitoxin system HipA family toxin [Porticoccus sp.]